MRGYPLQKKTTRNVPFLGHWIHHPLLRQLTGKTWGLITTGIFTTSKWQLSDTVKWKTAFKNASREFCPGVCLWAALSKTVGYFKQAVSRWHDVWGGEDWLIDWLIDQGGNAKYSSFREEVPGGFCITLIQLSLDSSSLTLVCLWRDKDILDIV